MTTALTTPLRPVRPVSARRSAPAARAASLRLDLGLVLLALGLAAWLPLAGVHFAVYLLFPWDWGFFFGWLIAGRMAVILFDRVQADRILLRSILLAIAGTGVDCIALLGESGPDAGLYIPFFGLAVPMFWSLRAWYRAWRDKEGESFFAASWMSLKLVICAGGVWALLFLGAHWLWAGPQNADGERRLNGSLRTSQVVEYLADEVGAYRINDATYVRALLASDYFWYDEKRMSRIPGSASARDVMAYGTASFDRWSGVQSLRRFWRMRANDERGIGVIDFRPHRHGWETLRVAPDSAAARAGIRRGDIITGVDGIAYDSPQFFQRVRDEKRTLALSILRPNTGEDVLEIMPAAFSEPEVGRPRIIETASRRVGYLPYNAFRRAAEEDLRAATGYLGRAGIDDLVLDLRYNHGGEANAVGVLAGLLAPQSARGKAAIKMIGREVSEDERLVRVVSGPGRPMANPTRLFVITSENTCSAAESIVMALRPYMKVITIGTTTCGKPVGYRPHVYGEQVYWVVSFEVENAKGQGRYHEGIAPDCAAEDDASRALGDPKEASLRAALHYAEHGRCA